MAEANNSSTRQLVNSSLTPVWHGKYFTLEEMTASPTARRLGIDNTPSAQIVANLQQLVDNVLDPLRLHWGRPVIVTSGYRCPKLNKAVKGAAQSQHIYGQAADIRTVSDDRTENMRLLRTILDYKLPFDKLIAEYVDDRGRPDWIHVSFSPLKRGIKLTCIGGRYITGIKIR